MTKKYSYTIGSGSQYELIDVGVREIDFVKENNMFSFFDGMPLRGVMTAKDESLMQLLGSFDTYVSHMINLKLIPCTSEYPENECAAQEEIDRFFTENRIAILATQGFIDFDQVLS